MSFIPELFLDEHKSGSVDKYKALEWYTRMNDTENIKILNKAGIYLREEDKSKSVLQVVLKSFGNQLVLPLFLC
jgi:hypothetical protein